MELRVLGAHNSETRHTRLVSLCVDGTLALDAGSITSGLTLEEQQRLRAILITHRHFDHVRDLLTFGINTTAAGVTEVYSLPEVLSDIAAHYVNGALYPNFTQRPSPDAPKLRLTAIQPGVPRQVLGYRIVAAPVPHSVPTVGYLVSARGSRSFFYTGDTAGGLEGCWRMAQPDLLAIEVTYPNRLSDAAREHQHMTPAHLERELVSFHKEVGQLPEVLALHLSPRFEEEIRAELDGVARRTGAAIQVAREDMVVTL